MTGVHEWYFGACRHGPLEEDRNKEWIPKGSAAHERLQKIVYDARWLKNIPKYLSFRLTSDLQSFHNHILMYASKRFCFKPPVYYARTLLAGLDYNYHLTEEREQMLMAHISMAEFLTKALRCGGCTPSRIQKPTSTSQIYRAPSSIQDFWLLGG